MVPSLVQSLPPSVWLAVPADTNDACLLSGSPALCWTYQIPLASPELWSSALDAQHMA